MSKVVSINIGKLQTIPWAKKKTKTGIFKKPISTPVYVSKEGVAGDEIGSTKYHGGPDQAVYLYSVRDYRWWRQRLGRRLPPGTFGENLTVTSLGTSAPRVGDLWRFSEVVLQLTAPRVPCVTLAQRMNDPKFVKTFAQANRSGAYARVIQPGELTLGEEATCESSGEQSPLLSDLFALCHGRKDDRQLMERALKSPLARLLREDIELWLKRLSQK